MGLCLGRNLVLRTYLAGVLWDSRLFYPPNLVLRTLGGSMPLKTLPTRDDEKFGPLVVNAVLTGIVKDHPEGFRYTDETGERMNCVYSNEDGSPSCLVGHVAHRLGIPLPAYGGMENGVGVCSTGFGFAYFTQDALDRLRTVQNRQDTGETWARAIR